MLISLFDTFLASHILQQSSHDSIRSTIVLSCPQKMMTGTLVAV